MWSKRGFSPVQLDLEEPVVSGVVRIELQNVILETRDCTQWRSVGCQRPGQGKYCVP